MMIPKNNFYGIRGGDGGAGGEEQYVPPGAPGTTPTIDPATGLPYPSVTPKNFGTGVGQAPFGTLEHAGVYGANQALGLLNQEDLPAFDPNNYLDTVMGNLLNMSNPTNNPYRDEMFNIGAENIGNNVMSAMGTTGRGMTFDPNTGVGNDAMQNYIDQISNFGAQFYGNAYDSDMDRALGAAASASSAAPGIVSMQHGAPWAQLENYANVINTLSGTQQPEIPEEEGTSGFDQLIGFGTILSGLPF